MKRNVGILTFCILTGLLLAPAPASPALAGRQPLPAQSSAPHQAYLPLIFKQELVGYFVAPNGSDSNPGTLLQPWKTLAKAARTATAGDTVYVRGGVYAEAVVFQTSGSASRPIRILAYPGETPVVDGGGRLPTNYRGLVSVFGDWVQVSGLEIRYSKYTGLGLYGKHDAAEEIFAHHNRTEGIYLGGDYGVIARSRAWRNSTQNEGGGGSSWSSGIVAANDLSDGLTEYALLQKNSAWENWGEGINTNESDQVTIEDNVSHDNFITNIYISDATHVICQRNLVYMNPASALYGIGPNVGIMLGDETYTPPSAGIRVVNNIAYGNHRNFQWWQGLQGGGMKDTLIAYNTFVNATGDIQHGEGNVIISRGNHQNVRFEDNLVRQDDDLPLIATFSQPGVTYSHNLWSKPPYSAASGPGDVIGDPLLAEAGTPFAPDWFRLKSGSPAIDAALPLLEVTDDFFAALRGSSPDIGAVEGPP